MKKQFNLLEKVKIYLSDSITEYYLDVRYDLEKDEYPDHFKELGNQLSIIDGLTSISDLVRRIDKDEIVTLSVITDEDQIFDETLNYIITDYFRRVAL